MIIDAYSKYPEVYMVRSMSANELIDKLRECFARFGIPKTLVTDNGTQFVSSQTKTFLDRNGIKQVTTPVASPSSNGQAENWVKTFKNKLKTALSDVENKNESLNTLICRFLLS